MIDIIQIPVPESGSTVFPRIFPRSDGEKEAISFRTRNHLEIVIA
jgi:hypothetical protein